MQDHAFHPSKYRSSGQVRLVYLGAADGSLRAIVGDWRGWYSHRATPWRGRFVAAGAKDNVHQQNGTKKLMRPVSTSIHCDRISFLLSLDVVSSLRSSKMVN